MANLIDNGQYESTNENIFSASQQGKKGKVAKATFAVHPEDDLTQQRRLYEQELSSYSGDDPLQIWYNYIKWIAQNYSRGGRDGNICKVIQQCLLILKDEKRYFDDNRFIDIWIKFAHLSKKSLEIYANMSNRGIGCQSSKFYIAWAEEAKQAGDMKQAYEILADGLQKNAQPFDLLKSNYEKFNLKFLHNDKNELDQLAINTAVETQNKTKVNKLPIKKPLGIQNGNQINQSQLKDLKPPIQVYNDGENPLLLPQAQQCPNSLLPEAKPNLEKSTCIKISVAEKTSNIKKTVDSKNMPSNNISRHVKNSSHFTNVVAKPEIWTPPVALFEPPNPMVRPMYDKLKVYGGVEELSFEEIRAMKWQKMQQKAEKERKRLDEEREKEELKMQLKKLQEKLQYLECLAVQQSKQEESSQPDSYKPTIQSSPEKNKNVSSKLLGTSTYPSFSLPSLTICTENSVQSFDNRKDDPTFLRELSKNCDIASEPDGNSGMKNSNFTNTYMANEVNCMLQGLYNGTLGNNDANHDNSSFCVNFGKKYDAVLDGLDKSDVEKCHISTNFPADDLKSEYEIENNPKPFCIYKDPTELLSLKPTLPFPIFHDNNQTKENNENAPTLVPSNEKENKEHVSPKLPFENYGVKTSPDKIIENTTDIKNMPCTDTMNQVAEKNFDSNEPVNKLLIDKETTNVFFEHLVSEFPLDNNLTLLTAEQFAAAARFASTPCISAKPAGVGIRELQKHSNFQKERDSHDNYFENSSLDQLLREALTLTNSEKMVEILKQILHEITQVKTSKITKELYLKIFKQLKICQELTNDNLKLRMILQHCLSLIEKYIEQYKELNQTNISHAVQLSTIMEASHESKSSSSSGSLVSMKQRSMQTSASRITKTSISETYEKLLTIQESQTSLSEKSEIQTNQKNDPSGVNAVINNQYNIDPFDSKVTTMLLKSLLTPISERENFYNCKNIPFNVKIGSLIELGNIECIIEHQHAEGAYAKVYFAQCMKNSFLDYSEMLVASPKLAVKVCKNANEWEFYTCSELNNRLQKENIVPDIQNSVLNVKTAVAFENCLVIVSDLFERGTLLDVVNVYKRQKSRVPETLVMFFALEMLHIISGIHKCGIIHGDVKPDNFMLNDISVATEVGSMLEKPCCLRLIDFGRAIDLTLFKPGITFSVVVKTDGFQCVQMREGRPWVFESDWYGVLSCIHILLFSEYMDVRKNSNGQWEPLQKFKRYFQTDIWVPLFQALLNIPSPYEIPDLTPFIDMLSQRLKKQIKDFKMQIFQLAIALMNRPK